ncbi:MAG: serine O-acetyltransferase [bacterium]|jgi:serine O-acetyltransferase
MNKQFQSNVDARLDKVLSEINETYDLDGGINHVDGINMPSYSEVVGIVKNILDLLFPGFYCKESVHSWNLRNWSGSKLDSIYHRLVEQVSRCINFGNTCKCISDCKAEAQEIVLDILDTLPTIRSILKTDVHAAYDGDPAAKYHEEVIVSYPGIRAISYHRIAHEFYKRDIPLLPRLISEFAHMETGIDIHPGAQIGESFFIDHGTGVVIGETCEIGKNVTLYQMVTLGAVSFKKNENGDIIKGIKRHPTIEDDVILYAGCTILGGNTVIGKGSVIGGNVWITQSVEPKTQIIFDVEKAEYRILKKKVLSQNFLGFGI